MDRPRGDVQQIKNVLASARPKVARGLPTPRPHGGFINMSAADDLSRRVSTAINLMPGADGEDTMGLHARWLLGEMMRQVKPADLIPEEVMGFLAILAPAHNRKLALAGNPVGRPVLRVVHDSSAELAD
jgi:hypothetical protein